MAIQLWSVDSLTKVFPDDLPPDEQPAVLAMDAARNEVEAAQLVLRCETQHLMSAEVEFSPPRLEGDGYALSDLRARFVGYVRVNDNTPGTPPEHLVRQAPADFPDVLLADMPARVRQNRSQPIWIEVRVPAGAPSGEYRGAVNVHTDAGDAAAELRVTVHDVTVSDERRLKVTNWISFPGIARWHGVAAWSEAYWRLLERYAGNLAEHRQNVILTPLFELIEVGAQGGGLSFDFTNFDRFVRLFQEAGVIGHIEGSHLGGRGAGGWEAQFEATVFRAEGNRVVRERARAGSEEVEVFFASFLPALQAHLARRGWLELYLQHVADEPVAANCASYNELTAAVKRYAPRLRTIDANMNHDVTDLDVWVPQLGDWHQSNDFYRGRVEAGDELWFYTCLAPTGTYANRFIDYHLLKTRLMHWLNFLYESVGYLHWGYNHWGGEPPFVDVEPVHGTSRCLPPGDNCIVYPGSGGPLDSIRFEAMRDGIEDYELLLALAAQDRDLAVEIARSVIRDFDDYDLDVAGFRAARRRLLQALSAD